MVTAAAYGCKAKVNLMQNLSDLENFNLVGTSGLFEFMVKEFPSTSSPDDKVPQSAEDGIDALQATLNSGTVLVAADTINSTSNNPGSLIYTDRESDANSYLTILSMALIGSLGDRYGAPLPNPSNHKTQDLPWTSATAVTSDGCAYASGWLNFFDGMTYLESAAPTNVASIYAKFLLLKPLVTAACEEGCIECGLTVSCPDSTNTCCGCPTTLRSRASCTGVATDPNSCAAAGLVKYFANVYWTTGPP
jgi:hypothetical protein